MKDILFDYLIMHGFGEFGFKTLGAVRDTFVWLLCPAYVLRSSKLGHETRSMIVSNYYISLADVNMAVGQD